MVKPQSNDPETWKFFNDANFAITQNDVPYTAINPDHGTEEKQKTVKLKAGFTSIRGNEQTLEKYFLELLKQSKPLLN